MSPGGAPPVSPGAAVPSLGGLAGGPLEAPGLLGSPAGGGLPGAVWSGGGLPGAGCAGGVWSGGGLPGAGCAGGVDPPDGGVVDPGGVPHGGPVVDPGVPPGLAGFWGEVAALLSSYNPAAILSGHLTLFRTLMVFGAASNLALMAYQSILPVFLVHKT